ncbi:MAG: P pilus assembly chaperone PapD [Paraglaciecola sp.]
MSIIGDNVNLLSPLLVRFIMLKYSRLVCMKLMLVFGACILVQSFGTHAAAEVSYSKFRFVFDDNARKDALIISNRGLISVNCAASLEHFIMGDTGPSKLATSSAEVSNSAEKLLRYAPRQANIAPNGSQVIRVSSRRRPGIAAGEYLSYLKLSCQEIEPKQQKNQAQINMVPRFISYFPLQVRVGDISASTHFENARIIEVKGKYKIVVEQYRQGERSIVGDIQVKDQAETVLGAVNNVVIYPPFTKREHSISLTQAPKGKLEIVFTEDKSSLGSLVSGISVKP